MKLTNLYKEFFNSEKAGGFILVLMTIFSLILANTVWQDNYINFWNLNLGGHSLAHWINDGLMTIFFLLIGLELEREIYVGELSNFKSASLPVFAAFGGMLVPAAIYLLLNFGTKAQSGAGIPMATDIAFVIGILALLGSRVPASLKIFLTALAVIDDLGAIIIIAIFYTAYISVINIVFAIFIFAFLLTLNRLKIYNLGVYLAGGAIMWYFFSLSGIHPSITGVLLAFTIPFRKGGHKSPSHILQHHLHIPVAWLILPLFALANTCVAIDKSMVPGLGENYSLGIISGLLIGKPLGIWLFSFIGTKTGLCRLPEDLRWKNIAGAGFLGGIGFTMSMFIGLLAFDNSEMINVTKISIFIGSLASGIIGLVILRVTLRAKKNQAENINLAFDCAQNKTRTCTP